MSRIDKPYPPTKRQFKKIVKMSNSSVLSLKTWLQKPPSSHPVSVVGMFFQTPECLYVQAGLPWRCVMRGGKPYTRVKEMSSAWDTDYGTYSLPVRSRQEIELNDLIRRGKTPFQGALGLNEIHCLITPQMGCQLSQETCSNSVSPQLSSTTIWTDLLKLKVKLDIIF